MPRWVQLHWVEPRSACGTREQLLNLPVLPGYQVPILTLHVVLLAFLCNTHTASCSYKPPCSCETGASLPRPDVGEVLGEPPPAGPGPAPMLAGGQGPQQELRGQGAGRYEQ